MAIKKDSSLDAGFIYILPVSIVNRQPVRGWRRKQKVGQEVFLAVRSHKYLLHSQQDSTAVLPAVSQVTHCALHNLLITMHCTHTVGLFLFLCMHTCLCRRGMTSFPYSNLHTVCHVLHPHHILLYLHYNSSDYLN